MRRIELARALIRVLGILPKRYPICSLKGLPQPFFILGSGRNGSTMLNLMLNQHPDIFLPSEQYFLGNMILKFQLYNYMIWRDLSKILTGELITSLGCHTWSMDSFSLYRELIYWDKEEVSLEGLIFRIYQYYADELGKSFKIWGDSTFLNTYYTQDILRIYPKSKYIFLLRDGRDVTASFKAGGSAAFDDWSIPKIAAMHWNKSIEEYDLLSKFTKNILLVKYEDLVQQPQDSLSEVFRFLGLELTTSIFDFHKAVPKNSFYTPKHHQNIRNPINSKSIGKWERELTEIEKAEVFPILAKNLQRFSYL